MIHRRILENKNLNINDWINLVFGYFSNGEKAREKLNLFMPYCYDNVVSCRLNEIDKGMQLSYLKLFELGVNPKQVFFTQVEKRKNIKECDKYIEVKIELIDEKNNKKNDVKYFSINENYYVIKDDSIIENQINFKNNNSSPIVYKINDILKEEEKNNVFESKISSFSIYRQSLVKSYYILGLENGITLIYIKFEEPKKFNLYKILNNHSKKINFIHSNDNLNMFIDCSNDDYIHLYTLPNVKLIHSIKIPNVNFVLLTSSPLPGFVTITNKDIFMFTLNGELVYKINNTFNIKHPIIIHDDEFNDYLFNIKDNENNSLEGFNIIDKGHLIQNNSKYEIIKLPLLQKCFG